MMLFKLCFGGIDKIRESAVFNTLRGKLVVMGETAKIFNEAEDTRTRDYVQGKFG